MTQKRGLGRGLGALIPGAGAAPQQEAATPSAEAARPSPAPVSPSPAPASPQAGAEGSDSGEETPALRTRTRPAAEAEQEPAAERPVDMFFSGEQSGTREERIRAERGSTRDLAGDMAKAAAERRGRGASTSGRSASAGSASGGSGSATSAPKKATPKKAAPKKAASTASGGKSRGKKASTPKPTAQQTATTTAAPKKAAASTRDSSKSSTTKRTAAGKSAATSSTASPTPAQSPRATSADSSPVVDVEEVTLTPARADRPTAESIASTPEVAADVAGTDATEPRTSAEPQAEPEPEASVTTPAPVVEEPASSVPHDQGSPAVSAVAQDLAPIGSTPAGGDLLPVPGAEFAEIPIHEIRENPRNPRTLFDEDELDELAASLRQVGVLQPVVVRSIAVTENGESFELVMGERRWRAATRAGLPSIPAIIRQTSDDDLLRDALLENLHRSQLNPLEEAAAYQQLLEDFGCTQDELGERIGRSRPQITNTLRLLRLPPLVQRRLASGALSAGHARALLSLDNPALMEELAQRIVAEGLSVRAVERLVAAGGAAQPAARTTRRSTYDPHVVDLTSRLSNRLETQVRIDVGKRKGRITMEFTNLEDLERLVENIGLDAAEVMGSED